MYSRTNQGAQSETNISLKRTPPDTPIISTMGHTQFESDMNSIQLDDTFFVNKNRNKRPRHAQSPGEDHDLKQEIMGHLYGWKFIL